MKIVFIHGMNKQQYTATSLRQHWLHLLKTGLRKNPQHQARFTYLKRHIRIPFYGDLLSRHHFHNVLNASTLMPQHPARGLEVFRDGSKATCLICHSVSDLPDRDQGVLGPLLDGIADIYSPQELRQRIIDARVISPGTIMPPYFSTEGLFRVAEAWRSKTIYSAQDVEDIVAYLMTLRSDP